MNDTNIGYCIVSGVLFLFIFGITSIVVDMILNKDKDIIIRKRIPKPEVNTTQFVSDDLMD
jgi:hypothetical protein